MRKFRAALAIAALAAVALLVPSTAQAAPAHQVVPPTPSSWASLGMTDHLTDDR